MVMGKIQLVLKRRYSQVQDKVSIDPCHQQAIVTTASYSARLKWPKKSLKVGKGQDQRSPKKDIGAGDPGVQLIV